MPEKLVYIGKIVCIDDIPGADFIGYATVVCGAGGKWRGIVRKADFSSGDLCIVYFPDAQLYPERHSHLPFMKDTNWRVKMRKFKGCPSEVVITRIMPDTYESLPIGSDVTELDEVTKYYKPIPENMQGIQKGNFPGFIPKTDEPNYQGIPETVQKLFNRPYFITEKLDGTSSTAYKYKGEFGVCSRNLELLCDEKNGYWEIAIRYDLENKLPDGYAIQWETCGPKIQNNPLGLEKIDGFAFNVYHIHKHRYLEFHEFLSFCRDIEFPTVKILETGVKFDKNVDGLGEGTYSNGKKREGVVVRSAFNTEESLGLSPISFKVINLEYDK